MQLKQFYNIKSTTTVGDLPDYCRRCSNYFLILDLAPLFNGLSKDNYNAKREIFNLGDLIRLELDA